MTDPVRRITVRALLLGDRIDTQGLERDDVLATMPLTFRVGSDGIVSLFRFGVAVLFGMSPIEEDEIIRKLEGRIRGHAAGARGGIRRRSKSAPAKTSRSRRAAPSR